MFETLEKSSAIGDIVCESITKDVCELQNKYIEELKEAEDKLEWIHKLETIDDVLKILMKY